MLLNAAGTEHEIGTPATFPVDDRQDGNFGPGHSSRVSESMS